MRDVEKDPRVGDVVQWHPGLSDAPLPAPLTVTEVTDERIYWVRNGEEWSTSRGFWSGKRIRKDNDRRPDRLELIKGANDEN